METFVGDTPNLILKTGIDLSGYAELYIKFKRPDGTYGKWTATQHGTNDTWMEYQLLETDLNQEGTWALQSNAKDTSVDLHGKWVNLVVFTPINDTTVPPTTLAPTTI